MQCTHREIHSQGEALGEDYMEVEGDKLCGGQVVRTLEEEHRVTERVRGQEETPMQCMLIEEEGGQNMLCMWKIGPYGQKLLAKEEKRRKSSRNATRVGKRQQRIVSSQLVFSDMYSVLCLEKLGNKVSCQGNTEGVRDVWYTL